MLDIIVLAAGKGTRMRSELPKVLHPVGGKALVQHVVDTARQVGGEKIMIIVGHGAEAVEQKMAAADVSFILQAEQLGTGHAVQQALPQLREDATVLILYGDVPLTRVDTLQKLVAGVNDQQMGLLTVNLPDPTGYGRILRDKNNRVTAIVEHKDASEAERAVKEVNTGIMAVSAKHLRSWLPQLTNNNAQGEYYLTDLIALAVANGVAIEVQQPDAAEEVEGINNRQQQAALERYYQRKLAEQLLVEGVTLIDPARFDCRGTLKVGRDVVIDVNCIFEGDVTLEDGVVVEANSIIINSRVGKNTHIKAFSHLEGADIAGDCDIGPYARLRPGTQLADGVKIGNFVETKKAVIHNGSKVNHLSYIGDAVIGKKVNVGAGTITCNYDGVNKFKTEIGDNAFIGSNSALVAPIKIGNKATIGAGSVITRDVADEELAVGRGKQRNIEDWKRPTKLS
ncbi:bifunctional UDP-N-acetylglucosamine diphosphorylase/glucosamine-1-phosphate N-acetyltransferase GlmU [Cellvibrio polysaccharolyticus]|uniref:Bifunctional protein GlmU n=1 Tax=Cellvibrio polysaccharolyticus TaxID=2082724 RepID=A0A928YU27_9GAMM|nr:bifunctional UDP-N-acetylglucosamine diphosphorylase/glucosamine-1-phosphate N-acetyltransferase GlmU [Cellvibrio polysaccharolyticus]MBE8715693.1 UDP-N-acetylglucosamine diphosphorylase/glucosamine-1-phosphate N-acetyltransferase [Cellvibrio polysaccharolyticus]